MFKIDSFFAFSLYKSDVNKKIMNIEGGLKNERMRNQKDIGFANG